jgi:hypothetical protein
VGSIEPVLGCSSWRGVVRAGMGLFALAWGRSSQRWAVYVGVGSFEPVSGRSSLRGVVRASRLAFRSSMGSFDLMLGRLASRSAFRPSVWSFDLALGRSASCLASQPLAVGPGFEPTFGVRTHRRSGRHPGVRSPQLEFDSRSHLNAWGRVRAYHHDRMNDLASFVRSMPTSRHHTCHQSSRGRECPS